ncbi:MAG: magnesium transporter [Eubacteriales bacterium]|nr:magnesium transporter [Eubacteriales bacterium]
MDEKKNIKEGIAEDTSIKTPEDITIENIGDIKAEAPKKKDAPETEDTSEAKPEGGNVKAEADAIAASYAEAKADDREDILENIFDEKKDDDDEPEEEVERPDYGSEIAEIIRSNASPKTLRDKLSDYHENDIADVLTELTPVLRKKVYRVLSIASLSEILEYTDEDDAREFLDEMDLKRAAAVINHMEPDTAVDILRTMEKTKRMLLMDLVDEDFRKDIILLASFDEDEIGSKMTTNYIVIHDDLTVKEAMSELIRQAPENDNISTIFVLDDSDMFAGAIDLKELIIARQSTTLSDLIMTSYPYVYGNEEIDDCIEKLKDYSEDLIPVLDNQNELLGVITSQSIIEVVDEALGEDYARLAGLTAEEDLEEPLKDSMRKRLPWLLILLVLGMVVASVIGAYEKVIAELTLIVCFQSVILDMAGNTGTQSLAVTIRVLMDENLTARQKIGHVFKEIRVGICNGMVLGVSSCLLVGLYIMFFKHYPAGTAFAVSGCVGISLMVAMMIAAGVGTLIPMFFSKIGVDPAVASGPLITTTNDLIAVVTYYSLAWVLLIRVLGLSG